MVRVTTRDIGSRSWDRGRPISRIFLQFRCVYHKV